MGIWYVSRETVKSAMDIKSTAQNDRDVDSAIESASRSLEGKLHRRFYPWTGTRYFDWPSGEGFPWRLWLDGNDLVSVTSLVGGGVVVPADNYFLRRTDGIDEPPFNVIELDLGDSASFNTGPTHQRDIAITGVYAGAPIDEVPVGVTDEALDATETEFTLSDASAVGVGSVLRIDEERVVVTGRAALDSAATIATDLTAQANNVSVPVSSGTGFQVGETILIDSERMLITDVAGNTLTAKRAFDGVLAAHTSGATVYRYNSYTVTRGVLGTTAATHSNGATVSVWSPPGLVSELCLAYALNNLLQRQSGYARQSGEGDNAKEYSGRGIRSIEKDAMTQHGRQLRARAV